MNTFTGWVFSYLLNSLWQIPLLFAAGWLAARAAARISPAAEHRVWALVQLAQALLPALTTIPFTGLAGFAWHFHLSSPADSSVSLRFGPGIEAGAQGAPVWVVAIAVAVYAAATVWLTARFLWRLWRVAALRRNSFAVSLTAEQDSVLTRCQAYFPANSVALRASSSISTPVTLGFSRPVVLLPAGMVHRLAPADFHTVIAHELAHIARRDFSRHLFCEALSLPASYHPLLWAARERVTASREMACDRLAAAIEGPRAYGRSLLRLASLLVDGMPAGFPHAIGVFDAHSFERRVMRLRSNSAILRGPQRVAIALGCSALLTFTAASLMVLGVSADAAQPSFTQGSHSEPPHRVSAREMADNVLSKVMPAYPAEAKKAGIQGKVVLDAVIGRQGQIESLHVISGPKELSHSALVAVRQWKYKPYLMNGEPVRVETTVNIIYNLGK